MILYYKDEDGNEHDWKELEEGIYDVRKIQNGMHLSFTKVDNIPEAIKIAQFIPFRERIAEKLAFLMFDPATKERKPIKIIDIFNIIENVISKGVPNVSDNSFKTEFDYYTK